MPSQMPGQKGAADLAANSSLQPLFRNRVLVTGGAGYIGSHMAHALADRGDRVVVLDDLSTGVRDLVPAKAEFVRGDVGDRELVTSLIRNYAIDAVIHFAGSVVVPESVAQPLRYYDNNTAKSCRLVEACVGAEVSNLIFSSTAAVYGMGDGRPATEDDPKLPINPYGRSKLMTEWALADAARAHDLRYVALRYFNVAGADPGGRTGQSTPRATHLIKRACQVALNDSEELEIFGTDFPTPDGTGIRDYIHVADLVACHLLALDYLRDGGGCQVFNCGYGHGASVREVIAMVSRLAGKGLKVKCAGRRPGDPAQLVANSDRIRRELGWQPSHGTLEEIVSTALAWERRAAGQEQLASAVGI